SGQTLATIASEWHHPDILRRQIADPSTVFLLAGTGSGLLIGVATVKLAAEGAALSILRLYVHPSYQRRGIGSHLLRHAQDRFPTVQRVELEVAEANLTGRAFWTKHGFRESGRTQVRVGESTLSLVAMENSVAP